MVRGLGEGFQNNGFMLMFADALDYCAFCGKAAFV